MLRNFYLNMLKKTNRTNINVVSYNDEKKKKSNYFIFLFCVLIATFFWLLIKLSDTYTEIYEFQVDIENAPSDQRLTTLSDSSIKISINANGFKMLKLNLMSSTRSLIIDLDKYDINNYGQNQYYINTSNLREEMADRIGIEPNNLEMSLEKLRFTMEKLKSRKINVYNASQLDFAPQYDLYSAVNLSPNTVTIFGPVNIIDSINYIFTENKIISNISSDLNEKIKLINPLPDVLNMSVKYVNISAEVEKYTESSLQIPIDLVNSNYQLKAFPNNVKVFFTVALKDFSEINKTQFKVVPNFEGIDLLNANKLQLKITEYPETVSALRLQPSEIEFLIIK